MCYHTADYTIRMNFTTVPRTWVPINRWRHDVSIHYKVSTTPTQWFLTSQNNPRQPSLITLPT